MSASAFPGWRLRIERYLADDFSLLTGAEMPRFIIYRGAVHTLH